MPLLFIYFCDLLNSLERLSKCDPPLLASDLHRRYRSVLHSWFTSYNISIHCTFTDPVVLLSSLFPAKRTDRVFSLQAKALSRKLRSCLRLGVSRWPQLEKWQEPGFGDLGDNVERILKAAENPLQLGSNRVTLLEVDEALAIIAARCRFSGLNARRLSMNDNTDVPSILTKIYHKLQSREAKWFTRMLLKDYSTIDLERYRGFIYLLLDPRLCDAMQIYDDFNSAINALRKLSASNIASEKSDNQLRYANDTHLTIPQVGIKVGPPRWAKAKGGIKHAMAMMGGRAMSIERKYDGEYCQIHVDLTRGEDCVQIYSKSGKDSTVDRQGVLASIKRGLRIGQSDCRFRQQCILEGELLVWSDKTNKIIDFHKIRKHVSRSGSFLGTKEDSQPHPYEHLMVMFYDILLVDNESVLQQNYRQRRDHLRLMVNSIRGGAEVVEMQEMSLSEPQGAKDLTNSLANAFAMRWEGLVVKPLDEPYFPVHRGRTYFPCCWIKMKKDCIKGLGDTGDFAVVGAGYDAGKANQIGLPNLLWTHFFIGCLKNKHDVIHAQAKPKFLIIDCVTDCIKKDDFKTLGQLGQFVAIDLVDPQAEDAFGLDFVSMNSRHPKLTTIFRKPFVFEVAGSGFEKGPDRSIFTLRFPRVLKIHWDREWQDCVDVQELVRMADEARLPPEGDLQEDVSRWREKLDAIDEDSRSPLQPWDFTDEEEVEFEAQPDEHVLPRLLTVRKTTQSRRSNRTVIPPLVRVDTPDFWAEEGVGMVSGEAIGGSVSSQAMKQSRSPTASPISLPSSITGQSPEALNCSSQRRKGAVMSGLDVQMSLGVKRRKINTVTCNLATKDDQKRQRPLQGLNNLAVPQGVSRYRSRSSLDADGKENIVSAPITPTGSQQCLGKRRTVEVIDLSSPMKESVADHCPSSTKDAIYTASSVRTLRESLVLHTQHFITRPSTEDASFQLEWPILSECSVLVGASFVSPAAPPPPQRRMSNDIELMNLSDAFQHCESTTDQLGQQHVSKETILLVNLRDEQGTVEDLVAIGDKLGSLLQPQTINVWDQSLLRGYVNRPVARSEEQRKLRKRFCARLTWQGRGMKGKDGMSLRWRGGEAERFEWVASDGLQAVAG